MTKYLITGGEGLVGSALVRKLNEFGHEVVYTTRKSVNLFDFEDTFQFFQTVSPTHIINAAAKVGGIRANNEFPATFISENLIIQTNVIRAAGLLCIPNFVFLGSSCIYPKFASQPISESSLLTGPLESTNEWYAIAKIAGLKMVEAYRKQYGLNWISVMPNNVYGPNDNFNPDTGHVIGALIYKFCKAKKLNLKDVEVWGSGKSRREFVYVDDLAEAILLCSDKYSDEKPINIGVGSDISIYDLAHLISEIIEFNGSIHFNSNFPDGTPQKLVNSEKLRMLGWKPKYDLRAGIKKTIDWYLQNSSLE